MRSHLAVYLLAGDDAAAGPAAQREEPHGAAEHPRRDGEGQPIAMMCAVSAAPCLLLVVRAEALPQTWTQMASGM